MTNVARTNKNGLRPASDLYSTRPEATHAFMRHEYARLSRMLRGSRFGRLVWEPAAGEGELTRVVNGYGFATVESDKYLHGRRVVKARVEKRAFGDYTARKADVIISNPPYNEGKSGDGFVRHALRLAPRYAAFFLPITFFASLGRADILEGVMGGLRLARVLVLAWRCTLKPTAVKLKSSGVVTYAWFIWERGFKGITEWIRLYRSEEERAHFLRGSVA